MKLDELIIAVKEERLQQGQLEKYHDNLSQLFVDMQMEIADIEKLEAIYMNGKSDTESIANRKVTWKATDKGQRLIELKRYSLATKEMINSLKSRTFRLIN